MTSCSTIRLLLLQSHRPIAGAIERLIERQQLPYILETTASPEEAVARLQCASSDVMLLDGTNGNGQSCSFLERADCSPVILLVDRDSSDATLRAARLGIPPCLVDPADDDSLRILPAFVENALVQKRRWDDLHRRLAELTHLQRVATISEMAADLAHELSQPLGAIASFSQACRHRAASLSGEGREDVIEFSDQIAEQTDRASRIVRRARDFVRRQDCPREPVDLNELIRDLVDFIQAEARPRGVHVALRLDEALPRTVADRLQIEQVVTNLVRNAIEAAESMPPSRRTVEVRASLEPDETLVVAVEDQAAGLGDEGAERFFEPFYTSKAEGMGLGLWISRAIVESHGGRLEATPGAEWGSVFRFTLPVKYEGV